LKNIKKFAPQEKVEMTPLVRWVCNLKYCWLHGFTCFKTPVRDWSVWNGNFQH
jgi:hypothetical protein